MRDGEDLVCSIMWAENRLKLPPLVQYELGENLGCTMRDSDTNSIQRTILHVKGHQVNRRRLSEWEKRNHKIDNFYMEMRNNLERIVKYLSRKGRSGTIRSFTRKVALTQDEHVS